MHKMTLERLARRALSDPNFRQHLLADPEAAVQDAGIDLLPQDLAALKAWQANLRDVTKIDELESSLAEFLASRAPTGM